MKLTPHIDAVLQDPEKLSVFGLILFTEQHPHIIKVLRDGDYWSQFDSISGNRIAIFSAKPHEGHNEEEVTYRDVEDDGVQRRVAEMRIVWREPAENNKLLSDFHLNDTSSLPLFIVFARLPEDKVLQCSIRLSDENTTKAYDRLKQIITLVSRAAENIDDQNTTDTQSVYNAFELQINELLQRESILEAIAWFPFVKTVLGYLPETG